ncbi:MAG: hypothetical protein QM674_23460 [Burkholderiaceae bacterium]
MRAEKAMARDNTVWGLVLAAAAIMMITTGIRQTTGLFVSPLNTATGLGIVAISFALAVAQFVWGAAQPVFAAVGDRYGALEVLIAGGLMLAAGTALTPFAHGEGMLIATLGGLSAAGAAAGSFALLVGVVSQRIAAVLGFTWLATAPPTAGIGKLFGARYLSTLFGLTLPSHQTGGFLGAWLGGRALASDGDFTWMWYADIVLATAAALLNLPIRESRLPARAAAAAA